MFNPIEASKELKKTFVDYITTSFDMEDPEYAQQLRQALEAENAVVKGPYLEMNGSYLSGKSLRELMQEGKASQGFATLEQGEDSDKELKIDRGLYAHQEKALAKARAHHNLVVTTGTGSGKTECFLVPVLDALLQEEEAGTLDDGVRALIIYPMNALANDQMKRLRHLLKDHPSIRFGLYNGDTQHDPSKALISYKELNGKDAVPLPNEALSRQEMQDKPPHILITNYSMLEYMMFRPKDDKVFTSAKLRYIILDEAHIYRGATGMETSLLMRRVRARIGAPEDVQYILTSATLGDESKNKDITAFANRLCGVSFREEDIIRSVEKNPPMQEIWTIPQELFAELAQNKRVAREILPDYNIDIVAKNDAEIVYELLLHSAVFSAVRRIARECGPLTITQFCFELQKNSINLTEQEFVDFISVCVRAEKDKTALLKARYHLFVRALEGAYITLNQPKQLFIQRKQQLQTEDNVQTVFECAVCTDCGRLALVGKTEGGKLVSAKQWDADAEYYMLKKQDEKHIEDEDSEEEEMPSEESDFGENEYVVCPVCGAIAGEAEAIHQAPCEHDAKDYVHVTKVSRKESGQIRCSCCGFGRLRRFYLGSEAATAVLGTELYELLPEVEAIPIPQKKEEPQKTRFFARKSPMRTTEEHEKARQFLCFSDSRSEAAYFACYMEKSYQEFLRRRGIWHVVEECKKIGTTCLSVNDFANRLARYFIAQKTFRKWNDAKDVSLDDVSTTNAWIAVLNEMYNARRSTSLAALGLFSFEYKPNDDCYEDTAEMLNMPSADTKALLNLLAMDAVYAGAIESPCKLTDADREYIFYAPKQKYVKKAKQEEDCSKNYITGWIPRKRSNGDYFPNGRVSRLMRATALSLEDCVNILKEYWDGVFGAAENQELALKTEDFWIRLNEDSKLKFYRCQKCGRITSYNCKNQCASVKCDGVLEEVHPEKIWDTNHYAKLYREEKMQPLFIKEHTAQLSKKQQAEYQKSFVEHKINALSCSTTFEMGVDVGTLETVYMRNMPPSPANYVQRAGRAGRSLHSAAFILTYAKLSSHDFTFFNKPSNMIQGLIKAPVFEIKNQKVIYRHMYAVALSSFFALYPEFYDGDDQSAFLNESGYEKFKEYLWQKPEALQQLLKKSIPQDMHEAMGILDNSWIETLIGENGILEAAVNDFRSTVELYKNERQECLKRGDIEGAGYAEKKLKTYRCAREDNRGKKHLINFFVRNNILPKYGFPVDTVELLTDTSCDDKQSLQLARDLQMAIAEYAPGSEVIADGKMYKSRYIRKIPGKNIHSGWEMGSFSECMNPLCREMNFTKEDIPKEGRACVSCGSIIPAVAWKKTLEPRMGFYAESANGRDVPMHRPEREYKSDDYYIGDPLKNVIEKTEFKVNGQTIRLESTSNDSLVVVVREPRYYVCPICGYASDVPVPEKHKNPYGYICKYKKESSIKPVMLSHDFKTDVVRIDFETAQAADMGTMLSVMYAILEGMSNELGIERTDIKGTLHKIIWNHQLIYSIILYDAVAGGAGHVRRLVTQDGLICQKVLKAAYQVVDECDCDSSCYKCLRNYYNQKIHEKLNRIQARDFIQMWLGEMTISDDNTQTSQSMQKEEKDKVQVHCYEDESLAWDKVITAMDKNLSTKEQVWIKNVVQLGLQKKAPQPWETVGIDISNASEDNTIWPDLTWPEHRIALFNSKNSEEKEELKQNGWTVFSMDNESITPENFIDLLQKEK